MNVRSMQHAPVLPAAQALLGHSVPLPWNDPPKSKSHSASVITRHPVSPAVLCLSVPFVQQAPQVGSKTQPLESALPLVGSQPSAVQELLSSHFVSSLECMHPFASADESDGLQPSFVQKYYRCRANRPGGRCSHLHLLTNWMDRNH